MLGSLRVGAGDAEDAVAAQSHPARVWSESAARRGRDLPSGARRTTGGEWGGGPLDWYGFTIAFKRVFLEGLEVAFIVVAFATAQHRIGVAALGAAAALVLVLVVGAAVRRPISRVPENTLKFGVGVMLTGFGMFWTAEGACVTWPGGDVGLLPTRAAPR